MIEQSEEVMIEADEADARQRRLIDLQAAMRGDLRDDPGKRTRWTEAEREGYRRIYLAAAAARK